MALQTHCTLACDGVTRSEQQSSSIEKWRLSSAIVTVLDARGTECQTLA